MKKQLHIILFLSFSFFAVISNAINHEETSVINENNSLAINRITNDDIIVTIPSIIFPYTDADIKLKFKNPRHGRLILNNDKIHFIINGEDTALTFTKGEAHLTKKFDTDGQLSIYTEGFRYSKEITIVPRWAILLPIILILLWGLRRIIKK